MVGKASRGPCLLKSLPLLGLFPYFRPPHPSRQLTDLAPPPQALERTFLGYLRTGIATATLGTVVAQLFAMQPPDSGFGYTAIGKPLATACYCFAMCITLLGALRVWRLQHALLLGKTLSGGFEIMTIAAGCLMLSVVFLAFLIALDVVKESSY
ncbi:hypothetical protein LY78DRAFT_425838 [Colletotrichum sublineola]|nr:hypothetical protein LY78DRAFT_425838 [Colletotrichum sublineola]